MITPDELKNTIEGALPGATVKVKDYTGTNDHYEVFVISADFEGKTRVEQHQLVFGSVSERIGSNEIHAMSLKTMTPDEFENQTVTIGG